ncbi:MAG: HAD family hydrolase [FCB group bacterium]|nr:HAD family hydrolase [FCB group bacterium]
MNENLSFKAVIFDLDGTLLNTLTDIADSMNTVLRSKGFPEHPVEKYKYFVGDGMDTLVQRTIPEQYRTKDIIKDCISAVKKEYSRRCNNKTKPYVGIEDLLTVLSDKNIPMAILTNKPHDFAVQTINQFLPRWEFTVILGAKPDLPKKPDPTGALLVANTLNIPPDKILYLGDTDTDMATATAAGMFPVGVLWGFRSRDELLRSGAKGLVRTPTDILRYF